MSLYISKENIPAFVKSLSETFDIFFTNDELAYQTYSYGKSRKVNLDLIRPVTPLKSFFFVNYEKLQQKDRKKPRIILGVKSCDLKALQVLDRMFMEGVVTDPFYEQNRKDTIIVTSDCPEPGKSCFCTLVGSKPYCEEGFDVNLAPVNGGYIADVGSENGEEIINRNRALFGNLSEKVYALRDKQRQESIRKLKEINKEFSGLEGLDYQKTVREKYSFSDKWQEESKSCVQCLGCNNICPSCFCFMISEEDKDKTRYRYWDACHSTSYARVAGGMNARPKLYERFRNRYQCKFNYRKENFGVYSCTGCGRCIEVCPGKIDIRKVIGKLV